MVGEVDHTDGHFGPRVDLLGMRDNEFHVDAHAMEFTGDAQIN